MVVTSRTMTGALDIGRDPASIIGAVLDLLSSFESMTSHKAEEERTE